MLINTQRSLIRYFIFYGGHYFCVFMQTKVSLLSARVFSQGEWSRKTLMRTSTGRILSTLFKVERIQYVLLQPLESRP